MNLFVAITHLSHTANLSEAVSDAKPELEICQFTMLLVYHTSQAKTTLTQ